MCWDRFRRCWRSVRRVDGWFLCALGSPAMCAWCNSIWLPRSRKTQSGGLCRLRASGRNSRKLSRLGRTPLCLRGAVFSSAFWWEENCCNYRLVAFSKPGTCACICAQFAQNFQWLSFGLFLTFDKKISGSWVVPFPPRITSKWPRKDVYCRYFYFCDSFVFFWEFFSNPANRFLCIGFPPTSACASSLFPLPPRFRWS